MATEEKDSDNTNLVCSDNRDLITGSVNLIRRWLDHLDVETGKNPTIETAPLGWRVNEFDEKIYFQSKPYFEASLKEFTGDKDDTHAMMATLLKRLADNYGYSAEKILKMKPYIVRFIEKHRDEPKSRFLYLLQKGWIEAIMTEQLRQL